MDSSGSTAPVISEDMLSCHCYNQCPEDSIKNTCSHKKNPIMKRMKRGVTMEKLWELEAINPAIPTVTLKNELQGNSGNPTAPETLTPSFSSNSLYTHPSPATSHPMMSASNTPSFSPSVTPSPTTPTISTPGSPFPPTPSFKPPPICPPTPASTACANGERLFSPSYLVRMNWTCWRTWMTL
ncbi:hypothetical protein IRJ41_011593 [Triplophysa rosa]|uniref:Uncharacterized protein n=1 Tax=Triplophysa rosa TaxID=992332 RepID=A0A9W7WBU2_TRIRA|nr:hypothetical protein IRJ41_011593 [Triplophysa rosa]